MLSANTYYETIDKTDVYNIAVSFASGYAFHFTIHCGIGLTCHIIGNSLDKTYPNLSFMKRAIIKVTLVAVILFTLCSQSSYVRSVYLPKNHLMKLLPIYFIADTIIDCDGDAREVAESIKSKFLP